MHCQRNVCNTNSQRKSGNFKVCAYWVSWKLEYLEKEISHHRSFASVWRWRWGLPVTDCHGDETWVHHFEPQSKRRLMEWCHMMSQRTGVLCQLEIMGTVFGMTYFLPKKFLLRGETILIAMLKEWEVLSACICWFCCCRRKWWTLTIILKH